MYYLVQKAIKFDKQRNKSRFAKTDLNFTKHANFDFRFVTLLCEKITSRNYSV